MARRQRSVGTVEKPAVRSTATIIGVTKKLRSSVVKKIASKAGAKKTGAKNKGAKKTASSKEVNH